jgi:gingipain R
MNMNDVYGNSGYDMTDTWHIFGDPSVCIRTATPVAITALHETSVFTGTTSLSVDCNTEGALVSLTVNGQILGTGVVASGNVVINFPALNTEDTLFVTATAFNAIPYEGFVTVTFPVSIADYNLSQNTLNILPNPAHEIAMVQFNSDVTAFYTLKIFNSVGQEVMSTMNQFIAGENSIHVNTLEFAKGIYHLKLETAGSVFTRKLVIE